MSPSGSLGSSIATLAADAARRESGVQMTDRPVIQVFHKRRRWYVQVDGGDPLAIQGRRPRAVDAAVDLAETIAPARVVVFTADGRLRRTITVGQNR